MKHLQASGGLDDEAPLTLPALVQGSACLVDENDKPIQLRPGDVAVIRGPEPHTVADDPDTPRQPIVRPARVCITVDGADPLEPESPAGRRGGRLPGRRLTLAADNAARDGRHHRLGGTPER